MLSPATVALRPDNTLYPVKHPQPMASLLPLNGHELTECSQSTVFKELNFSQTPPPHPPTHRRGVQTPAPLSRRARGRKGQGTRPGSASGCSAVRNRVSIVYSSPQTGRTTDSPQDRLIRVLRAGVLVAGSQRSVNLGCCFWAEDGLGFHEWVSLHQEQPPTGPG